MFKISRGKIENVVVSSSIEQEVNLDQLHADLPGSKYDPDSFPGLVYRYHDPKATILVFRTGKLVCTGTASEEQAREAIEGFSSTLSELGIAVPADPATTVVNVVGSYDFGSTLDLNAVALGLGLNHVEYSPEQFPGLVYRIERPKVVALLFGSGKCVITGAKTSEDVSTAIGRVRSELEDSGLL